MQNSRSYSIKNSDNIKLPLAYIKKIQNTAEGKALIIDKTAPLIMVVIDENKTKYQYYKGISYITS